MALTKKINRASLNGNTEHPTPANTRQVAFYVQ